jgi:hypothetical protein
MSFPFSNGLPGKNKVLPGKNKVKNMGLGKILAAKNRGTVTRSKANATIYGFPLINVSVTSNSIDLPYNYTYNGYSGQVNGFTALSQLGIQNTNNLVVPVDLGNGYRIINFYSESGNPKLIYTDQKRGLAKADSIVLYNNQKLQSYVVVSPQ